MESGAIEDGCLTGSAFSGASSSADSVTEINSVAFSVERDWISEGIVADVSAVSEPTGPTSAWVLLGTGAVAGV